MCNTYIIYPHARRGARFVLVFLYIKLRAQHRAAKAWFRSGPTHIIQQPAPRPRSSSSVLAHAHTCTLARARSLQLHACMRWVVRRHNGNACFLPRPSSSSFLLSSRAPPPPRGQRRPRARGATRRRRWRGSPSRRRWSWRWWRGGCGPDQAPGEPDTS